MARFGSFWLTFSEVVMSHMGHGANGTWINVWFWLVLAGFGVFLAFFRLRVGRGSVWLGLARFGAV